MNITHRLLAAAAIALTVLAVCVADAADFEIQRWEASAGTEIVLVEDHRAPLVHVVVEFPVGHWSPWAWEHHAEEAFDVQPYDPAGTLRARADRLSADLSVGMGSHASAVHVSCLREDLGPVLELVRDVLINTELDRHELKRWTKGAKLDWNGNRKDPEFRLRQAAARRLYEPDDPRRRGYEKPRPNSANVRRLVEARDVVVRLPGRVIGFAGDLKRAEIDTLVADLLPPVLATEPEGLKPALGALTPHDRLPANETVTMPRIQQTFFALGRHSLTYDDPAYPAFLVADHVLGGHFFSRLYKALRHEGGETYGAWTEGDGGLYREGYAMVTFTREANREATEAKLWEVLRTLHEDGITEDERSAAVGYLVGRRPFSRQSPRQILDRFLWERRHDLPPGFWDDLIDRAAAVSLEDVHAFVERFYDPDVFSMLKVTPK